jgi:UDP-N-acetylglucosamine acyltransferase
MFTEPDWKGHTAVEGSAVSVGHGTVIRENVIINLPAKNDLTVIGSNCYLMNTCFVGHDCIIGNNVTLGPHACVAGHVTIGDHTNVGMNASIHQDSTLGKCCMIGAGAFFKGTSPDGVTWVGVPARPIKVNTVGISRSGLSDFEKQKITLEAQLFVDEFECSRYVKTEGGISAPRKKTGNIIFNCVRWLKGPHIFDRKFGL